MNKLGAWMLAEQKVPVQIKNLLENLDLFLPPIRRPNELAEATKTSMDYGRKCGYGKNWERRYGVMLRTEV